MNRGLKAYTRTTVEADTPAKRLDDTFQRALLEMQRAKELIEKRDPVGKGNALNRAVDIVSELLAALDPTIAPELCERLSGLYVYVLSLLAKANVQMSVAPLQEATKIISDVRWAFAEASQKSPPPTTGNPGEPNGNPGGTP